MGSEPVEELPDDLEAWVAERAAADDTSRAEVIRRLMTAHKLLDEHPDHLADADVSDLDTDIPEQPNTTDAEVDDLDASLEELAGRVGELEANLDEKITDVRQRVIQVKREADAKAPAEHDHPAIVERIDEGFENYEEVLEYLTAQTQTLEDEAEDRSAKLHRVANAVVDLRRRVAALEGEIETRAAVAELREAANRRGISEATCGSCGGSVRLGLLEEPTCPHCESAFEGIESGGWFRSNRLTVGNHPALESGPTPSGADDPSGHTDSAPSPSSGAGGSSSESPAERSGSDAGGTDPDEQDTAPEPSTAADDGTDVPRAEPTADTDGFAGEPADGNSTEDAGDDEGETEDDRSEGGEIEAEDDEGADDR